MKRLWYILIIITMMYSCKKGDIGEKSNIGGSNIDNIVIILIVDESFNDRLNPDSPAYFGDNYTNEIKVLYYHEGEKLTFIEEYYATGGGKSYFINDVENHKDISPSSVSPLGFSSIDCTTFNYSCFSELEGVFSFTYISYPDGSEDEIKVEYNADDFGIDIDKLWINGELAYDKDERRKNYRNGNYIWLL